MTNITRTIALLGMMASMTACKMTTDQKVPDMLQGALNQYKDARPTELNTV